MAGEISPIAEVSSHEDDRVQVSLPVVGFPPGFKLRSGDRVVVVQTEHGPVVRTASAWHDRARAAK